MTRSSLRARLLAATPKPKHGSSASSEEAAPPSPKERMDQLIAVLKSDAPRKEKADACRELGVLGTQEAVPALAALLPDEKLSHMARYGLEPIPSAAVDEALRDALGKAKGRPLVGVIGSLGVRRDAKAVGPLSRFLEDPDADVVQAAARSLGKIATTEAARALRQRLASAPADLRRAVADATLACAERLIAQGQRAAAAALYESVGKAELPEHFRLAATKGAELAR